MLYLLSLPLSVVCVGLFMIVRAFFVAPEGYEDEAGFHLSAEGAPSPRAEEISFGAREALICR